jgi:hypothetical protein
MSTAVTLMDAYLCAYQFPCITFSTAIVVMGDHQDHSMFVINCWSWWNYMHNSVAFFFLHFYTLPSSFYEAVGPVNP